MTGLPNIKQLERLVDATGLGNAARMSLLLIDVIDLKQINTVHGRSVGDDVLRHVVRQTRAGLQVADLLFRYGSDEFVALLNDADPATATAIASHIRDNIRDQPLAVIGGNAIKVAVTVTCVCAPRDGQRLQDLMSVARLKMAPPATKHQGPRVH